MIPVDHISDNKTINRIASSQNAFLKITSVVTSIGVTFPAFLTDFSQTFDAKWNTEEVFGRMDPIATYQGTQRTMSLGFDVPAGSEADAYNNLSKCQSLVKMVYPVYKNNTLAKPPLVRIRFANLLKSEPKAPQPRREETEDKKATEESEGEGEKEATKEPKAVPAAQTDYGVLGWISGLSWKPNLEMGMFVSNGDLLPKVISISFSFNVLHEKQLNQEDETNLSKWPFGVS